MKNKFYSLDVVSKKKMPEHRILLSLLHGSRLLHFYRALMISVVLYLYCESPATWIKWPEWGLIVPKKVHLLQWQLLH